VVHDYKLVTLYLLTVAGFLVFYAADTARGSSGAPVMRLIDRKYRVVAIHRGTDVLNYGSLLSEIIYHVENMEINPGSSIICVYIICTCILRV